MSDSMSCITRTNENGSANRSNKPAGVGPVSPSATRALISWHDESLFDACSASSVVCLSRPEFSGDCSFSLPAVVLIRVRDAAARNRDRSREMRSVDMQKGFGQLAVEYAGRFEDPDKPEQRHQFEDPQQLARCIDLLLPTAQDETFLAGLPRRLQECAEILADDSHMRIDGARRAVEDLSECFENYLQLIALLKYSKNKDLLFGDNLHRGLMRTTLGGLLHGRPERKNPAKGKEGDIPKARIVTYDEQGRGRRDRIYRATKRIRNQVHSAQVVPLLQVLHNAKIVLAAYLFATEENVKLISHVLYEHGSYLNQLLSQLQSALPSVVEPELEGESSDHRNEDRSSPKSVRTSLADFEKQALKDRPNMRFAVYGDPGAGKTTFVFELTRRLVESKRRATVGEHAVASTH